MPWSLWPAKATVTHAHTTCVCVCAYVYIHATEPLASKGSRNTCAHDL